MITRPFQVQDVQPQQDINRCQHRRGLSRMDLFEEACGRQTSRKSEWCSRHTKQVQRNGYAIHIQDTVNWKEFKRWKQSKSTPAVCTPSRCTIASLFWPSEKPPYEDMYADCLHLRLIDLSGGDYTPTADTLWHTLRIHYRIPELETKLQRAIFHIHRHWLDKQRGPALYNRTLCQNADDLATCEPIHTIPGRVFYSYTQDGRVYGADIRSMYTLIKVDPRNPYTRVEFPVSIIRHVHFFVKLLTRHGILTYNEVATITLQEQINTLEHKLYPLRMHTTTVQHPEIHQLTELVFDLIREHIPYVQSNWFTSLSIIPLRMFVRIFVESWYRNPQYQEPAVRQYLCPGASPFYRSPHLLHNTNENELRRDVLFAMYELLTRNPDTQVISGLAIFIMQCFARVSHSCLRALPWLLT